MAQQRTTDTKTQPPNCVWEYYCSSTRVDVHDVTLSLDGVVISDYQLNTPTQGAEAYEVLAFYYESGQEKWVLEHHDENGETWEDTLNRDEALDWLRRRGAMVSTALH
jgi:hypothetical protein